MELEVGVLTDAAKRAKYYEYLNGGVTYGYITGSYLAWYEGVKVLHDASLSVDPAVRGIYDDTYRFVKDTYTVR